MYLRVYVRAHSNGSHTYTHTCTWSLAFPLSKYVANLLIGQRALSAMDLTVISTYCCLCIQYLKYAVNARKLYQWKPQTLSQYLCFLPQISQSSSADNSEAGIWTMFCSLCHFRKVCRSGINVSPWGVFHRTVPSDAGHDFFHIFRAS